MTWLWWAIQQKSKYSMHDIVCQYLALSDSVKCRFSFCIRLKLFADWYMACVMYALASIWRKSCILTLIIWYRQQSANKESSHHPSSSNHSRTEALTGDLEDAEKRVTECKDRYATEMLTFISKETEICQRIVDVSSLPVPRSVISLQCILSGVAVAMIKF